MIINVLEEMYRADARELNNRPRNVFRASSSGLCERRLGYELLGVEGEPLQPRRLAVLKHGTILDTALKADLRRAFGDRFLNLDELPGNRFELEGVTITFTPDGAFQSDDGQIGIVEFKTMAEFSFDRALKGEIDRQYLCQAWCYHEGTGFNPIVFVCYRKNTSAYCEVIFDRNVEQTIVTQRFGGDPRELYLNDPLLVAEVRTPFDPSVETEVREKFRRLSQVKTEADLAPGVRAIEPEVTRVQGRAKADEHQAANPIHKNILKSGSWYTFETGRQIAKFPCSYCAWVKLCLNARLEIKDSQPRWIIESGGKAEE